MSPKVSILVPAYNHESFIRACLDSLVHQTFSDWEAVVIDDGSSDRTPTIAEEYARNDARIRFYRQANQGVVRTASRALKLAQGSYASFLASDDFVAHHRLEKLVPILDARPELALVCTDATTVDPDGNQGKRLMHESHKRVILEHNGNIFSDLLEQNFILSLTCLFRRDLAIKVGGINENISNLEDWDLWLRMTKRHPIAYLDESLAFYRKHQNNATKNYDRVYAGMRQTFLHHVGVLPFAQRWRVKARVLARFDFEQGQNELQLQNKKLASRFFMRAAVLQPLNPTYRQAWLQASTQR